MACIVHQNTKIPVLLKFRDFTVAIKSFAHGIEKSRGITSGFAIILRYPVTSKG